MSRHRRWTRRHLDALLQVADPLRHSMPTGDGIETALDAIGTAIAGSSPRMRRPNRRRWNGKRRTALLLGAAALVIGAGVATGAILSAHTGRFPTKPEQVMGGPGEELNPGAPDFRAVALQIASDIPYPQGYESWRDFLISDEIRWSRGGALESSGALHGWFAASAFCAWVRNWRQARLAGDERDVAHAAQEVSAAPGWKAVTDEDPHPSPAVPGDLGSTKYTLFGWMLPYRDAVHAGDLTGVEHLLADGYGDACWSSDPAWTAELTAHREQWRTFSQAQFARQYEKFLARVGS